MDIYLDIETIPTQRDDVSAELLSGDAVKVPSNYKDEAKIAAYRAEHADESYRATALSGDYGEIICISWAVDDGPILTAARTMTIGDERAVLSDFFSGIRAAIGARPNSAPVFVGHNIEFDLRFLHHRSIVLGVEPGFWIPYNAAVWHGKYVDTMYEWCGAKNRIKLTELCRVLGIEVHDEIDGSQVWDAYQAGKIDQIAEHCEADVERVRQIFKRLKWRT